MTERTMKSRPNVSLKEGFALHPNFLIRVCGEPANLINDTTTGETYSRLVEISELLATLEANKEDYCKIIEDKIPGLEDKSVSNKLLKIKRNIFNIRAITPSLLDDVKHMFDDDSLAKVEYVVGQVNLLHEYRNTLEDVYKQESATISERLESVWDSKNLQHALSYSNTKLFTDFDSLYKNPGKKIKPKKRRQLEAGLMRYASRSSLKTSPLSTFTPVFVGSWKASDNAQEIELSGELENRTEVKSGLFQAIIDNLLSDYAKIRDSFCLRLNPSLKITQDGISLKKVTEGSSVNGRVWGSGELDVQFKMNQVIQCVLVAFHKLGKESASVEELVAAVLQLAPKLQSEFVEQVIAQLLDMQVFNVDSGFYGQVELLTWCKSVVEKAGQDVTTGAGESALLNLQNIESLLQKFPLVEPVERVEVGRQIYSEITALTESMQTTPSDELSNPAFFENSYLVDKDVCVDASVLNPFVDDFTLLTELSPFFDVHQLAQTNFADFFLERFGADGECEDSVAFIKEFSELYGVGLPDFVPDAEKLAPTSEITRTFRTTVGEFIEHFIDQIFTGEEHVSLDQAEARKFIDKLPLAIKDRGASHSFLGQIASKKENQLFIINQVFSGHSGLLSRFLEVLEEEQLQDIRDYLTDVSRDGHYAEIPGLFGFNANKHPKLADNELLIPPFPSNREETGKVALDSLSMVYDKATHKVYFKTADGKLMDCFYHGFLMPLLLPNMHRVLTLLGMNGVLIYVLPILRSGRFSTREKIGLIPRVSLGNIVLVRKSYMIPRELLPSVELSEVEFFSAIQLLIKEHSLPTSGFVRVSPFDTNPGSTDSKLDWANLDFKNMKPFYVDFHNPRLVQLLYLAMSRHDYPIVLSESLPDVDDQNLKVAGEYHVSEFQFEMTKKPAKTSLPISE